MGRQEAIQDAHDEAVKIDMDIAALIGRLAVIRDVDSDLNISTALGHAAMIPERMREVLWRLEQAGAVYPVDKQAASGGGEVEG